MPEHVRDPPHESRSLAGAQTTHIHENAEIRATSISLRKVQLDLIDVTAAPIFTWLKRLHNWVLGMMKVFGRVFVFRWIAAAHVATLQA
jgi:hypothetical protein